MIEKPVSRLVQEFDAKSFTVIGSTCYGGLGAEAMHLFRSGLAGAEGDFIAVVGDVVPIGRDPFYGSMARFIDACARKPVHVLKSNNDGPDFGEYFGHANRAVIAEDFVLVMLDNSDRRFSDDTLAFLRETMAIVDSRNVIVAFHVPPPNRISGNTMEAGEWNRFEEAAGVWRSRISLLISGHDHSYYEDDIDGLRLVVSGGAAAVNRVERVTPLGHHALEVSVDGENRPVVRRRVLEAAMDEGGHSGDVHARLVRAYNLQGRDHVSMRLHAEDAWAAGQAKLALFYRAAGESALSQARILHRLLTGGKSGPGELSFVLEESRAGPMDAGGPGDAENTLARHTLGCVDRTQSNTLNLLARIQADDSRFGDGYFLCTSCAMLYPGREAPNYCSACGAPYHSIREVK